MNNKLNPIIPLIGKIHTSLYIDQGVPIRAWQRRLSKKNKMLRELITYVYYYFHEEIFEPYE